MTIALGHQVYIANQWQSWWAWRVTLGSSTNLAEPPDKQHEDSKAESYGHVGLWPVCCFGQHDEVADTRAK